MENDDFSQENREEIQKADPNLRKKEIIKTIIIFIVGFLLYLSIKLFQPFLTRFYKVNPVKTLIYFRDLVILFVIIAMIPVFIKLKHLCDIVKLTVESKRFPPPSVPVIKDTKVLYGNQALKKANSQKIAVRIATVLILFATSYLIYAFIKITSIFIEHIG